MNKTKKDPTPKKASQPVKQNKIYRSEDNKVLGGIAGGLGEYFNVDPVVIRIIVIILAMHGAGVLLYLILWAIVPTKSKASLSSEDAFRENVAEMKGRAKSFASEIKTNSTKENSRTWLGIAIIVFGALLFFENLGIFGFLRFDRLWPLLLVVLGIVLLTQKVKK